jgi:excisionase family DNA binding protein
MPDDKLTLSQAAQVIGLSESHLRKFCQSGDLPAERITIGSRYIWRVSEKDLHDWRLRHEGTKGKAGRPPNDN